MVKFFEHLPYACNRIPYNLQSMKWTLIIKYQITPLREKGMLKIMKTTGENALKRK